MIVISDLQTLASLSLVEKAFSQYAADFGESNLNLPESHVILQFRRTLDGLGLHGIEIPVTSIPIKIDPIIRISAPNLVGPFFVRYLYNTDSTITFQGFEGSVEGKINRFDATGTKIDAYDLQPVLAGTDAFQYVRVSHHDYLYYNFPLGSKAAVFEALKASIPLASYTVMEKDFNDLLQVFNTTTVGLAYKGADMYSYYMLGLPSGSGKILDSPAASKYPDPPAKEVIEESIPGVDKIIITPPEENLV